MIREIKEIMLDNIEKQELSKDEIENAKTLYKLGLDFNTARKMLEERNIPVILHEEDKEIFCIPKDFKGTEDFILVHKTDMAPKNSRIITASESGDKYLTDEIEINGEKHEISYKQERYVVNFALNHEVISHSEGNWDNTKYAILIPWNSIPNEQIIGGLASDIFTNGSVDIKDGYILAPKGEKEQIKKDNPELTVIEYDGDRVLRIW